MSGSIVLSRVCPFATSRLVCMVRVKEIYVLGFVENAIVVGISLGKLLLLLSHLLYFKVRVRLPLFRSFTSSFPLFFSASGLK